ncbi:CHAD domain-containing protein [uncultured Caulobacter sp.]|uniref:CYTH and CHAD domain-containing protein n=1 Tax=uncultured Caulobacter sp. TaxID=158749 RepID=UPI002625462B|nr:CHAD domain-containing protein [uncultured Caulobacter sp.]
MDREIELKFLIPPEAAERALAGLPGEGETRRLDATYFDTPDHALRKAGFGLRVRDGDGGRKQTLKSGSAGGVFARGEWEEAVDGPAPDRKALWRTPVAAILEGRPLTPVFSAEVERTIRTVRAGDAVIEAALDRGALSAGDRRAPICELELELKSGAPAALFDLARDIARRAPLRLSLISKAERGYDLAAGGRDLSFRPRAEPLDPHATVAETLQALGRAALARLCEGLEAVRDHPEPDSVHQARVATRRLRALLKIFKPLARDEDARRLDDALDWLAGEFDNARDLDVFLGEVWAPAASGAAFAGRPAFETALQAAHARAYIRVSAALQDPRARDLLLDAAAWLEAGAWTTDPSLAPPRERRARAYAREVLDHRLAQMRKGAKRFDDLDAHGRHRLRLKGKILRYAVEDFAALFPDHPKRVARFVAAAKAAQDTLGALNDRAVQGALIQALAADDTALARDAARIVLNDDEEERLRAAEDALERLLDAKTFW